MLVREVMTSPVITVTARATVKEAIGLMAEHDVAAMPVVDGLGRIAGVISEADVIREMIVPDPRAHQVPVRLATAPYLAKVGDVMSNHPLSVTSDTELAQAADLLTSTTVKSLPVVDQGRLVGILSRRDIIHMLARQDSRIEADIDDLFRDAGHDWLADVEDGIVTVDGPTDDKGRQLAETLVCTIPGVVGISFTRRLRAPSPR